MKSVFWRVAKRLSYIEEARCLKVNTVGRMNNSGISERSAQLRTCSLASSTVTSTTLLHPS